jgi:acyl transferase domain-containing protein
VAAGPKTSIAAFARELERRSIQCRYLNTSHAFHSAMMDPILDQFAEVVRKAGLSRPRIPFVSSATGTWITDQEAVDPLYWSMQIRKPVRFHAGRQALAKNLEDVLIEVGPGRTLSTLAKHPSYNCADQVVLSSLAFSRESHRDTETLLNSLGQLWLEGVPIDWEGFYAHERRSRVALPSYPFERKRYWIDPPKISPSSEISASAGPTGTPVPQSRSNPESSVSATVLEKILSEQLEIMSKQLEVLGYVPAAWEGVETGPNGSVSASGASCTREKSNA